MNSPCDAKPKLNANCAFKFASLNVCGLKRRADYPEFIELVNKYDLICFSESKIDENDVVSIPGYMSIDQPRRQKYQRKSGGISVFYKQSLSEHINNVNTESDYILWFELDKSLANLDENIFCGAVYIPPENSNFYNDEELMLLESEITSFCSTHKYLIITGDVNARTAEMKDYTENDDFLSELFDFDPETVEFFSHINKHEKYDVLRDRQSRDRHTNNSGYKLIDMCKNHNLFILNGRFGKDKAKGNFTFRQSSVIDYTLVTTECLQIFRDFEVNETDSLSSDGHCLLSHSLLLDASPFQVKNKQVPQTAPYSKWIPGKSESFCRNINLDQVKALSSLLDSDEQSKDSVKEITEQISEIFSKACEVTFPKKRSKPTNKHKPWFGPICKSARKKYHLARKHYKHNKTHYNRTVLNQSSKSYKKTMNKFIAKHRKQNENKLRSMQTKRPKEYWKFINSLKHRNSLNSPSLNEFYEHFKNLNAASDDDTNILNTDLTDENEVLNTPITTQEILHAINKLHNGKATGLDKIANEHIKETKNIFIPIYEKLFNLILDTGIFPEQWSTGTIKPIYKNKGDHLNTQNYRPITILSCLGKLFTSILNERLNDYLEENDLLSECQAGFRQNYSTLDHVFPYTP